MDFPLIDYLDEGACHRRLVELLHPDGLACPRCGRPDRLGVHGRRRAPTASPRGSPPPRWLASWAALLALRHRLQERARIGLDRNPLGDAVVEADEMYQNAGGKGIPRPDPADPPRRRANRRRGHGTFADDRPPIAGVVGRRSGEFRSQVLDHADGAELEAVIESTTLEGTMVHTDEWKGYDGLPRMKPGRATVDHSGPESTWARDDDGDGVREAHCNTQGGLWNFLRPFRGVSKWYLAQYQAIFQWGHKIKRVDDEFLRILLGFLPSTGLAS